MDNEFVVEGIKLAEEKRLKNIRISKNLLLILLPLCLIAAIINYFLDNNRVLYVVFGLVLLLPFAMRFYAKSGLVKFVKRRVILPALKKLRPNLTYNESQFITKSQFYSSNLFKYPDRYKGEDLVSGYNGKTEFSFSEIHAEEKHTTHSSNGHKSTRYTTIFKGIFMIAEFNKHIKKETYVLTSGRKWFSRFKRVRMEDPEFEDRFNVYSDDQIEARYILTPVMMQKISKLEDKFNSQLFMSFRGNYVFIALGNSNNYFEPNVSKEINMETINEIITEIDSCISIINDLDLNTRIWTKE